jgi:hypothetical protein
VIVRPFRVNIAPDTLDDLRRRLTNTRWADEIRGADWNYGTNLHYLRTLVQYWREEFDWRVQEERINRFAHFRTVMELRPSDGARMACAAVTVTASELGPGTN